ncbi:MAG: Ig-like domain-containing protein, partial [Propionibacteriaceae bacterium]|nr:Ig-like domain-containing protein [Propionibacteriaceae bacterium]
MRRPPAVAVALGLVVGLIAALPSSAAPAVVTPLASPLAGTLSQRGGASGWAASNADAITAAGLDPDLVGTEATGTAAGRVQTVLNTNGSATLCVGKLSGTTCSPNSAVAWTVGSVLGDATATETLSASGGDFSLGDHTPLFTDQEWSEILLGKIGFSFAIRWAEDHNAHKAGDVAHWGHYYYDVATRSVVIDDTTTPAASLNDYHDKFTVVSNWGRLNTNMQSETVQAQFADPVNGLGAIATSLVTQNNVKAIGPVLDDLVVAQANQTDWGVVGTAAVPFSFGLAAHDLASPDMVTVQPADTLPATSWLTDLKPAAAKTVAASLSGLDWESAFDASTLAAIADTNVEQAFETAFGGGLDYAKLAQRLSALTEAQLFDFFDPILTQITTGTPGKTIQTRLADALAAIQFPAQPIDPNTPLCSNCKYWIGYIEADPFLGLTQFPSGDEGVAEAKVEPAKEMYKYWEQVTIRNLLAKIKAKANSQAAGWAAPWEAPLTAALTGTVKVTKSFTPGKITSLVPTDVRQTTTLDGPTAVTVVRGEAAPLGVAVADLPAASKVAYSYTVTNPAIAAVSSAGVVTGVSDGTTNVTVTATATCTGSCADSPRTLTKTVAVTVRPPAWAQGPVTAAPTTPRTAGTGADSAIAVTAAIFDGVGDANGGLGSVMPDQEVTFTLEDADGGQPTLSAESCVSRADGTCEITVTSTAAGSFLLHAWVHGGTEELTNSPLTLTWTAGPPAAARSGLVIAPASVRANAVAVATVTLQDQYGNPVTGLKVADMKFAAAPTGLNLLNDFTAAAPGVYTASLRSTQANTYTVEAQPLGLSLAAPLTVTPGDPANLALGVGPAAVVNSPVTVTASVTDQWGNPVSGVTGLTLGGTGLTVLSGPAAGDGGTYAWQVTAADPGTWTARVTLPGTFASLSATADVTFQPGAPGHIELSLDPAGGTASTTAGTGVTATVTVTDQWGHPITTLADSDFTWSFSQTDAATGAASASSNPRVTGFAQGGDGTYTWKLTSPVAGAYTAAVLAQQTADSANAHIHAVTFTPGPAATATLALERSESPINQPVGVTYTVKDALGNGLALTDAQLAAAFSATPAGLAAATGWTAGSTALGEPTGVYTAALQAAAPNHYPVHVDVADAPAATAALTLTQSVGQVTLALTPSTHVVADAAEAGSATGPGGVVATVTVAGDGSPVTGLTAADIEFGVTRAGQAAQTVALVPGSFRETGPGQYTAILYSTVAGAYSVTAATGGQTSAAEPLTFTPDVPDATLSTWTVTPATVALPENGAPGVATATFTLRDRFGNPIPGQGNAISVTTDGPGSLAATRQSAADGVYSWQLSTATQGQYTATATAAGLPAKTASVTFKGLIVSKANSGLAVAPAQGVTSDAGGTTVTATVTVRDSAGQGIPGLAAGDFAVTSAPAGVGLADATFAEVGAGVYTVGLYSTVAGAFDVTVSVVGVTLDDAADHAHVTFAAVPRAATAKVVKDQAMANGADQGRVQVAVTDGFGNPAAGAVVTASAAGLAVAPIAPTDDLGQTIIAFTAVKPGTYEATVAVEGAAGNDDAEGAAGAVAVAGSPAKLTFGAACLPGVDEGCAPLDGKALPHLEVVTDGAAADGIALDTVKVVLADQQGNPLAKAQVRAALDGGAPGPVQQTDADGAAVFSFASTVAGAHQVTVEVYSTGAWRPVTVAPGATPAPPSAWVSSPASVTFAALPVDPERSSLAATPASPVYTGAGYTVTATLLNRLGEPVEGAVAVFAADLAGPAIVPPECQTDNRGSCSVHVTATAATAIALTASVDGAALPQTLTLAWEYQPFAVAQPSLATPLDQASVATAAPRVTGTGEAGGTVTVTVDGQPGCSAPVAADGTWDCALAGLADGRHVLSAVQTSTAPGALPSSPVQRTFYTDTVAPAAPVVESPADGAVLASRTPRFAGTAEEGTTITVAEGDQVLLTTMANSPWAGELSPLADGPHTVAVTATDAAGNVSPAATLSFTVKTSAAVALAGPAEGAADVGQKPSFTGTSDPGNQVTVREGGVTLCAAPADPDGNWSCLSDVLLDNGLHTVAVTARDAAGNTAPVVTRTFRVGPAPLAAPHIVTPTDGLTLATATPEVAGDGAVAGNNVTVMDAEGTALCTSPVAADGTWACVTSPLADGPQVLHAVQASAVQMSDAAAVTVVIAPPHGPDLVVTLSTQVYGSGQARFAGQVTGGATVSVTEAGAELCTASPIGPQAALAAWTCTTTAALADGEHVIEFTATDATGTSGTETRLLLIDRTPPAAPTVESPAAGSVLTDASVTFAGAAEDGAIVTLTDGEGSLLCSVAATEGAWSCQTAGLPEGPLAVWITAEDALGNQSPALVAEYTVDARGPDAPVIESPTGLGTLVTSLTPTVAGTGQAGAVVTVVAAPSAGTPQADYFSCASPVAEDGSWSCVLGRELPLGPARLTATQADARGRTSAETAIDVVIAEPEPTASPEPVEYTIETAPFTQRVTQGTVFAWTVTATAELTDEPPEWETTVNGAALPAWITATV